jgi:hypothetical protein
MSARCAVALPESRLIALSSAEILPVSEELRAGPEEPRRIPQAGVLIGKEGPDHLGVELARQLEAADEGHRRYDPESACLVRSVTRASTAASTASPADRYSAALSPVWNAA